MKKVLQKIPRRLHLSKRQRNSAVYIILVLTGALLIGASLLDLLAAQLEYHSARSEYDLLRRTYMAPLSQTSLQTPDTLFSFLRRPVEQPTDVGTEPHINLETEAETEAEAEAAREKIIAAMTELIALNPDFVGWINIEGTAVDYPVVRAEDNLTYIDHSFNGKRNSSGAIFMDYRCNQGFDDPLCLIYGHNMKDGSMFHALISYLDPEFREAHLKLTIITHEGQVLPYRISDVRWTDAFDQVFFHEISQDAEDHLLILSTCSSDVDPDARLLVFAKPVEDK